MRLKKAVAQLIERERVHRVATANAEGLPHLVPVCATVVDGKICFGSGNDARKVKNLETNPRCTVTVDLYSDDWAHLKGVMVQGHATLVARGPRFRKIRGLLYRKYPQYATDAALEESDSVVVEVTPTAVFTWGLD
jgi:nitroimidazol reductase NimA-like FMN-containing flavoprotein (pyridoxamine 5'-phosphate oxidase superfamily)